MYKNLCQIKHSIESVKSPVMLLCNSVFVSNLLDDDIAVSSLLIQVPLAEIFGAFPHSFQDKPQSTIEDLGDSDT